jgi:prevent-host-death family protein
VRHGRLSHGDESHDVGQHLLYNSFMAKTVSVAEARANLPQLLKDVEKGETIVISRYRRPVAILSPAAAVEKPVRRLGTGKGRVRILDPHAFDPMTDEEVEAMLEDRY